MVFLLGLAPDRFKAKNLSGLDLYFALCRGHEGAPALDMSKYLNTNYHYLVRTQHPYATHEAYMHAPHAYELITSIRLICVHDGPLATTR